MSLWGPAAKPGDQARISDVIIKDNYIRFEINGGPVKKQKWYQHIQIQGAQSTVTPGGGEQPKQPARFLRRPRFRQIRPRNDRPGAEAVAAPGV